LSSLSLSRSLACPLALELYRYLFTHFLPTSDQKLFSPIHRLIVARNPSISAGISLCSVCRLDDPDVRLELGFLYGAYENNYYWFEMVDMAAKLTLTSLGG